MALGDVSCKSLFCTLGIGYFVVYVQEKWYVMRVSSQRVFLV